jgi:hypothetical protein
MELSTVDSVRSTDLDHHLRQAGVWLSESNSGRNTSYLSYAALELRLTAERLVLQYWADLHVAVSGKKIFKISDRLRACALASINLLGIRGK